MPLILGPRPKLKNIQELGATVIYTLLKPEEAHPEMIGKIAGEHGIMWVNAPLDARPHNDHFSEFAKWLTAAKQLDMLLQNGHVVYLHCAAGIHRTGCLAYLHFRLQGLDPTEAKKQVFALRPIIEREIGGKIDLLEELFQAYLYEERAIVARKMPEFNWEVPFIGWSRKERSRS